MAAPQLEVEIVADARVAVEGLAAYLADVGVAVGISVRADALAEVRADVDAVVVFPDELDAAVATEGLLSLRVQRPQRLLIVVTGAPQRYRPALEPQADTRLPLVMFRPAFGWAILDAIREHAREAPE
jgi:hypothetical protein